MTQYSLKIILGISLEGLTKLVDGRIISRWIFRKGDVGVWTGLGWLRVERVSGHF
jgi:hypothetical protein